MPQRSGSGGSYAEAFRNRLAGSQSQMNNAQLQSKGPGYGSQAARVASAPSLPPQQGPPVPEGWVYEDPKGQVSILPRHDVRRGWWTPAEIEHWGQTNLLGSMDHGIFKTPGEVRPRVAPSPGIDFSLFGADDIIGLFGGTGGRLSATDFPDYEGGKPIRGQATMDNYNDKYIVENPYPQLPSIDRTVRQDDWDDINAIPSPGLGSGIPGGVQSNDPLDPSGKDVYLDTIYWPDWANNSTDPLIQSYAKYIANRWSSNDPWDRSMRKANDEGTVEKFFKKIFG